MGVYLSLPQSDVTNESFLVNVMPQKRDVHHFCVSSNTQMHVEYLDRQLHTP